MPVKRPTLANNEIYHIVTRGTDGRTIFQNESDYYRAIHDLFEFNDIKPVRCENSSRRIYENCSRNARDLIVEILAFCLMPNHLHLLLKQLRDNGISAFMRKFGAGYVGYFNKKYERQGHLFQGRFRAVLIKTDQQLKSVFVYIHTNSAVLVNSDWQEGGIKNPEEIIQFIENYKWSSYPDYLGKENFPSVTQRDFFESIMPREKWQEYVNDWVRHKDLKSLREQFS
ncbi:MAG: hypothetical protein C0412_21725 [Flavobacterium sp.]|nr:hypothetical protein [Flavobacterium sp.]